MYVLQLSEIRECSDNHKGDGLSQGQGPEDENRADLPRMSHYALRNMSSTAITLSGEVVPSNHLFSQEQPKWRFRLWVQGFHVQAQPLS